MHIIYNYWLAVILLSTLANGIREAMCLQKVYKNWSVLYLEIFDSVNAMSLLFSI